MRKSQAIAQDECSSSLFCQPCELDGKLERAFGYCQDCIEHLCETCYKLHRRPAPCRNHILLTESDMPKSMCLEQNRVNKCKNHDGQVIEYRCKTHNIFGCSRCITLDHKTCEIVFITDTAKQFETSEEFKIFLQDISSLKKDCGSVINVATETITQLEKQECLNRTEIRKFRQNINKQLDIWENSLVEQNDSLHANQIKEAKIVKNNGKTLLEKVKQIHGDLESSQKARNYNVLYIKALEDANIVKEIHATIKNRTTNLKSTRYRFYPDQTIENLFASNRSLGEILPESNENQSSPLSQQQITKQTTLPEKQRFQSLMQFFEKPCAGNEKDLQNFPTLPVEHLRSNADQPEHSSGTDIAHADELILTKHSVGEPLSSTGFKGELKDSDDAPKRSKGFTDVPKHSKGLVYKSVKLKYDDEPIPPTNFTTEPISTMDFADKSNSSTAIESDDAPIDLEVVLPRLTCFTNKPIQSEDSVIKPIRPNDNAYEPIQSTGFITATTPISSNRFTGERMHNTKSSVNEPKRSVDLSHEKNCLKGLDKEPIRSKDFAVGPLLSDSLVNKTVLSKVNEPNESKNFTAGPKSTKHSASEPIHSKGFADKAKRSNGFDNYLTVSNSFCVEPVCSKAPKDTEPMLSKGYADKPRQLKGLLQMPTNSQGSPDKPIRSIDFTGDVNRFKCFGDETISSKGLDDWPTSSNSSMERISSKGIADDQKRTTGFVKKPIGSNGNSDETTRFFDRITEQTSPKCFTAITIGSDSFAADQLRPKDLDDKPIRLKDVTDDPKRSKNPSNEPKDSTDVQKRSKVSHQKPTRDNGYSNSVDDEPTGSDCLGSDCLLVEPISSTHFKEEPKNSNVNDDELNRSMGFDDEQNWSKSLVKQTRRSQGKVEGPILPKDYKNVVNRRPYAALPRIAVEHISSKGLDYKPICSKSLENKPIRSKGFSDVPKRSKGYGKNLICAKGYTDEPEPTKELNGEKKLFKGLVKTSISSKNNTDELKQSTTSLDDFGEETVLTTKRRTNKFSEDLDNVSKCTISDSDEPHSDRNDNCKPSSRCSRGLLKKWFNNRYDDSYDSDASGKSGHSQTHSCCDRSEFRKKHKKDKKSFFRKFFRSESPSEPF